jgi:hypothetical protein
MRQTLLRILTSLVVILILLISVIGLFSDRIIPYFVNMEELKAKIETAINQSTGIRAEITELSIQPTLFDGIRIVFDNNILYDPEDVRVVRAGQVNVNIRYLPLLRHKTSISGISFNHIQVYIGERSFLFRLKKPKVSSKDVYLENTRLALNDYHIIVDRYFDGRNSYYLDGDTMALSHVESDQPLILNGTGVGYFGIYHANNRLGRFRLYGVAKQEMIKKSRLDWEDVQRMNLQLQEVELPTLATIFSTYGIPLVASGRVGTLALDYRDGQGKAKDVMLKGMTSTDTTLRLGEYAFQFDPGNLFYRASVVLDPKMTHATLNDMILQLTSQKFRLFTRGDMQLQEPFETSSLDLYLQSSWVPVSALQLIPRLTPFQLALLASVTGDFSTDLHVVGPFEKPQVTGSVMVQKLGVSAVGTRETLANDVKGAIHVVNPYHIRVRDLSGMVAESPFYINGEVNLRKRSLQAMVSATEMNLSQLQRLILQFFPNTTPLTSWDVTGKAGINLSAWGALLHPNLLGDMTFNGVNLSARQGHLPFLTQLTGGLKFHDKQVTFQNLQGKVGRGMVQVHGDYNRQPAHFNLRIKSEALDLGETQQTLMQLGAVLGTPLHSLSRLAFTGRGVLDVSVKGSPEKLLMAGEARLLEAGVTDLASKVWISDITTQFRFDQQTLSFSSFTGQFQGMPFTASGVVNNGFRQLDIALKANNIDLAKVQKLAQSFNPALLKDLVLGGRTSLDLKLAGPVENPLVTGTVQPSQAQITYLPKKLSLTGLTGALTLFSSEIGLGNLRAMFNGVPVTMNGTASRDFKRYRVAVQSQNVALIVLQDLLRELSPTLGRQLNALGIQGGRADLNLVLAPGLPYGVGGTVTLKGLTATPEGVNMPILISQVSYTLESGRLQFPAGGVQVGNIRFKIQGTASAKGYQLHLVSQQIPVEFLRDEKAMLEKLLPVRLPTLYNTEGALAVNMKLTPALKEASIHFYNAGASMRELKYPLYNVNGTLNLTIAKTIKAYTDNLSMRYGNSPVALSFDVNGLQDIYLESTGTVAPLLINDWLFNNSTNTVSSTAVPFDINLSGKLGKLSGEGEGNNLNMFFNFNVASLFSNPALENPAEAGDTSLNQATLSSVLQLVGDTLNVEQTRFRVGQNSSVLLSGQVRELFTPLQRHMELSLITEPILDLTALSQQVNQQVTEGLAGTIIANLKLILDADQISSQGHVTLNHVRSTELNLEDLDGTITFNGIKALLNINHFQFPGVDVGFTGVVDDLLRYPLPISDFNVVGKQFIVSMYTEWLNHIIVGKIRQGFWEQFFPNTGHVGRIPFEINSGTLQIAEGIINNLIVEDFTSTLRVYPNTYFELGDVKAKSAGGFVSGHFAMNPRDNNFMVVHLDIDKMKANAVSRILLNVTNQIFGDLSGVIDYNTEGQSPEEFLANTNGFADLRIEDGRLPAIAKIENLLIAANTISGGLANLNLNSLFRLAAPFNTNYFATLTGTFKIVEGIVYTDDLLSKGEDLDLTFKGTTRMVDGYSDMLIHGEMSRDISGVLGPLGQFSIGRLLGLIPPLRTLIGHIPGIGFVPGFGGPRGHKGVAFEVRIEGPALDPGSIKDFHWVQ